MGVPVDPSPLFKGRRARMLDFSSTLSIVVKVGSELRLSRQFPQMRLSGDSSLFAGERAQSGPSAPGSRAAARKAQAAGVRARTKSAAEGRYWKQLTFAAVGVAVAVTCLLHSLILFWGWAR